MSAYQTATNVKTYIKNLFNSISGDKDVERHYFTNINLNDIHNYLEQQLLHHSTNFRLSTKDDFDLLMSNIDWHLNEIDNRSLREWEIDYYQKLRNSKIRIYKSYTHYTNNSTEYIDLIIKDYSTVSHKTFINKLCTFQVRLNHENNGTNIFIKLYDDYIFEDDSRYFSKSILENFIFVIRFIYITSLLGLCGIPIIYILNFFFTGQINLSYTSEEINFTFKYILFFLSISIISFKVNQIKYEMIEERLRLFHINLFEKTKLYDFLRHRK
jgi:hypothetical protein